MALIKSGVGTINVFGFLTTKPSAEVGAIHPKATPVILTTPEECEAWMMAPREQARALQRPLSDGSLQVIAHGMKRDRPGEELFPQSPRLSKSTHFRARLIWLANFCV